MLTEHTQLQSTSFMAGTILQVTLDQDYPVPDDKANIEKVIAANGEIQIQNIKYLQGKTMIKGSLFWRMVYLNDRKNCTLAHMEGELPFEEIVNIDGLTESAQVRVDGETEDLRVTMIHSRKISVRSVVNLKVTARRIDEIPAVTALPEAGEDVCVQKMSVNLSPVAVQKKETIRIREEMQLPGNKANIMEIIWGEIQNRHVDIRPQDEKISLRGEAAVFLLYSGENEENPFEYAEADLPWHTEIPCSHLREDMIVSVHLHKIAQSMEIKADRDGEMRLVMTEMVLEVEMTAYEEQKEELITDVYSLNEQIRPVRKEAVMAHVLIRNQTECKLYDKVTMPIEHAGVLQLCHPWAQIRMDRLEETAAGIKAEGVVDVHILYVNDDDQMPLDVVDTMLPFSSVIETGPLPDNILFEVQPSIDQLSAVMTGAESAEVRMTVRLDTLVSQSIKMAVITELEEQAVDDSYMESLPSMTGYIVKKEDSLFSIGKKFCTTADRIKKVNQLEKDEVTEGERLLIMKHMTF